jgi:hypothetical protein
MKWSEGEINFLLNNYERGIDFCLNELKRTKLALRKRLKKLGYTFPKIKNKYRRDNLEKIIKESYSIGEVLDKINLRRAGGNYSVINKYINLYNIDTLHFVKSVIKSFKRPLISHLVENSTYSRKLLKDRLYKEGMKVRFCELCGQGEIWNGMKISLILDHINGVHNDNRLENLRIVCPNCNAGLDTHAGRNNRKVKDIGDIGETTQRSETPNRRKVERPSYDDLKEKVSKIGYSATGREYGVSDNSIRKWIKHYEKN